MTIYSIRCYNDTKRRIITTLFTHKFILLEGTYAKNIERTPNGFGLRSRCGIAVAVRYPALLQGGGESENSSLTGGDGSPTGYGADDYSAATEGDYASLPQQDGTYLIRNATELASVFKYGALDVSKRYRTTFTAEVVDMSFWGNCSIGTLSQPFTGQFDFGNLTIKYPGASGGLFPYMSGAEMRNLTMVKTGPGYAAGISALADTRIDNITVLTAGSASEYAYTSDFIQTLGGASTIENCKIVISGDLNISGNFGAFCGEQSSGTMIRNSSVTYGEGNMTVKGCWGGIAAVSGGTIENCYSEIPTEGIKRIYKQFGGLVGMMTDGASLQNSYAKVNIDSYTGTVNGVGGLVGNVGTEASGRRGTYTVSDCYATGDILTGYGYVGGIIGGANASATLTVRNCHVQIQNIIGYRVTAGIIGADDYSSKQNMKGNFTFTDCTVQANITITNDCISGYSGAINYAGFTFERCSYKGGFTTTATTSRSIGNFVGWIGNSTWASLAITDGKSFVTGVTRPQGSTGQMSNLIGSTGSQTVASITLNNLTYTQIAEQDIQKFNANYPDQKNTVESGEKISVSSDSVNGGAYDDYFSSSADFDRYGISLALENGKLRFGIRFDSSDTAYTVDALYVSVANHSGKDTFTQLVYDGRIVGNLQNADLSIGENILCKDFIAKSFTFAYGESLPLAGNNVRVRIILKDAFGNGKEIEVFGYGFVSIRNS